jgi:hypothetical protein
MGKMCDVQGFEPFEVTVWFGVILCSGSVLIPKFKSSKRLSNQFILIHKMQ